MLLYVFKMRKSPIATALCNIPIHQCDLSRIQFTGTSEKGYNHYFIGWNLHHSEAQISVTLFYVVVRKWKN